MVTDMILPFVSLLPMFNKNLPQQFVTLRRGPHQPNGGYNTIQQAEADGAIYLAYGWVIYVHTRPIDLLTRLVAASLIRFSISLRLGSSSISSLESMPLPVETRLSNIRPSAAIVARKFQKRLDLL